MAWQRAVAVWRREAGELQPPVLVHRNRLEPRSEHAGDVHYELEIGVVLRGAIERQAGEDAPRRIGRGQVWLCGMWEPHRYRVGAAGCDALVVVVRPDALAATRLGEAPQPWLRPFAAPPASRPQALGPRRAETLRWAERMLATRELDEPQRQLERHVLVLELLLLLARGWRAPAADERDPRRGALVERALALLFERRGALTAEAAARAVGVARNRFNAAFAELMGRRFADFALGYRLGGAAGDLAHGDDPLKAIARRWGFTDASHLVRRFRERYGRTPAQHRRQMRTTRA